MEIKELLLREIGKFKNNKIIFSNYHVSTDNMNKHNQPIFYSKKGNLYEKTNILMSNIRPYFNKVWYSDRTGSKSSNVLCFVVTNNNVLSKYAYYLICSDKFNNFWSKTSKGTTMPVGDKEAILNFKFKICDKATQQKIINIIEPKEDLFLKYHKVVDITTLETFTRSWANLINIIEPFENLKSKILKNKNKLINFIDSVYKYISSNSQKEITLLSFANLFNEKYLNQNLYVETSNINENMSITNTLKNITKNKKPSRANLSVAQNSLIFSKLIGSKKIFPIYDCNYTLYVYSTGFYNISANELNWYLLGFLNSKDFEIQKNNNSSGTLMEGITIEGLKKVKLKIPNENYELNIILKLISKLNLMLKNIDEIINKLIQLYVV